MLSDSGKGRTDSRKAGDRAEYRDEAHLDLRASEKQKQRERWEGRGGKEGTSAHSSGVVFGRRASRQIRMCRDYGQG